MDKTLIIIAAIFVATAAGQFLDSPRAPLHRRHDYSSRSLRYLLGHPLERSLIYGESLQVPRYLQDDIFDVTTLRLEDVIIHPLFPVYMGLPYFQQYWQYPMFQRYVGSQYFQRFWEVPGFQQYFVNPVLFYKYIFPLVNIFKYEATSVPAAYGYPYGGGIPFHYYPLNRFAQVPSDNLQELYYKSLLERMLFQGQPQYQLMQDKTFKEKRPDKSEQTDNQLISDDAALVVESTLVPSSAASVSSPSSEESDEFTSEQETSSIRDNTGKYENNPAAYMSPILHLFSGV